MEKGSIFWQCLNLPIKAVTYEVDFRATNKVYGMWVFSIYISYEIVEYKLNKKFHRIIRRTICDMKYRTNLIFENRVSIPEHM